MKFDENGEEILDYKIFANRMQIPPSRFYAYIHPDPKKRHNLGMVHVGNQSCCLMRNSNLKEKYWLPDRVNDGYSIKEATDLIMTLKPEVNWEAAQTQLTWHVIPDNHAAGILKKKQQKFKRQRATKQTLMLLRNGIGINWLIKSMMSCGILTLGNARCLGRLLERCLNILWFAWMRCAYHEWWAQYDGYWIKGQGKAWYSFALWL